MLCQPRSFCASFGHGARTVLCANRAVWGPLLCMRMGAFKCIRIVQTAPFWCLFRAWGSKFIVKIPLPPVPLFQVGMGLETYCAARAVFGASFEHGAFKCIVQIKPRCPWCLFRIRAWGSKHIAQRGLLLGPLLGMRMGLSSVFCKPTRFGACFGQCNGHGARNVL